MESRFIKTYFTLFLLTLALIGVFNWVIDPYTIFNNPVWSGINEHKTETSNRQRLSKAYEVIRKKPATLIMGNSTSLALAVDHPAWKQKPVYLYALSSADMYETLRYFQHATSTNSVREVVLGLDIEMFIPGGGHPQNFDEGRLALDSKGKPTASSARLVSYIKDVIPALFSWSAFKSSLHTIRDQTEASTVYEKGKEVVCQNPSWQHERIRAKGGSYEFLLQIPRKFLLKNLKSHENTGSVPVASVKDSLKGYASLKALLRHAHKNHVKLYLYISPTHVSLEESWYVAGVHSVLEQWARKIVQLNETVAREEGRDPFPFWDFSGYNSINTESLPADGDLDTPMKWFWESVHFKRETGHFIIDRLLGYRRPGCPLPSDFGIRVSSKNINAHLAYQQNQRLQYLVQHPKIHEILVREVEKLRSRDVSSKPQAAVSRDIHPS
jgi:hypothetical protein